MAYQPYADNVAIGTKKRRNVQKVSQDTSYAYSNSYEKKDKGVLAKNNYDVAQGVHEEKRGRKKSGTNGNSKKSYKTSSQKVKGRRATKHTTAKKGGK